MSTGWEAGSKVDKEDIQYNLMFLEESPRLDDRLGSVFRAAMRELQRLGYAETYTADGGKTAWRLTEQGRQAAERIPAQRRADFEEAKHIAAESGGLAGEWWLWVLTSAKAGRRRRTPKRASAYGLNRRHGSFGMIRFLSERTVAAPFPRNSPPAPRPGR